MPTPVPTDDQLELIVRSLPAAPRILAELAPRLQALDADVPDITRILRRDTGLTARLIDMANSAAFLGFETATTIEDAVARVGFRETYRIVGAVASTQLADEPLIYYSMPPQRLRENSLFCAVVMEELAESASIDAGTAYTVGLLRSIGKVALDRLARHRPGILRFDPNRDRLVDWERYHWGCSNADIAAHVLEIWDFPEEAVEAVRRQYDPGDNTPWYAHLLNVAAGAAESQGFGLPGEQRYWRYNWSALERTGIDEAQIAAAAEQAAAVLNRVSPAFA
jgi:HD-like signal output (HDOD) protein